MQIEELLKSIKIETEKYDTVLKCSKLEQLLFKEKKEELDRMFPDDTIKNVEEMGREKLRSFPALTQDLFEGLYNINPCTRDEEQLTVEATRFNKSIIDKAMSSDEFAVLKQITEGRDFESMEAAKSFLKDIYRNIDDLLNNISGEKKTLEVMGKLEEQIEQMKASLIELGGSYRQSVDNGLSDVAKELENKINDTCVNMESKKKQLEYLKQMVDQNLAKNSHSIDKIVTDAVASALNTVKEIDSYVLSWGTEAPGNMRIEQKKELVDRIKKSTKLKEISKLLGRYRQMAVSVLKNSYRYGLGEKYDIELGNDINRVLSSELALLALPETRLLFVRKYMKKRLKQYRKRERSRKGRGDIIALLDESSSTTGGKEYWTKAVAISLLDIAIKSGRNFACVHFSTGTVVDRVTKENYNPDTFMSIAERFLGGGTNFEIALKEAIDLLDNPQFCKADIVFVSDGENSISKEFLQGFNELKKRHGFSVVGVLLDRGSGSVTDATMKMFCDKIYKTSEMADDDVARNVLTEVN